MNIGWQVTGFAVLALVLAGAPASEGALAAGKGGSGGNAKPGDRPSVRNPAVRHHHHRSRSRNDFGMLGGPVFWPWGDYPPYYPLAVTPVEYIERGEQEASAADHWLYCGSARSYFPDVGECAEGWVRVPDATLK